MKAAIVVFPGSNCDDDCRWALESVCGVKTEMVWYRNAVPDDADLIVLPCGFSYGDYLRAGALARFAPSMESVKQAADQGLRTIDGSEPGKSSPAYDGPALAATSSRPRDAASHTRGSGWPADS